VKPIIPLAAAAALCAAGIASAQSSGSIGSAPANRSTGPAIPDTRSIDQSAANAASGNAGGSLGDPTNSYGDGRTSTGLNADPDIPNGAPGPRNNVTR